MISIVIPVYNEKESLAILHEEIAAVATRANLDVEVFFVDDGSRDGSWNAIADIELHSIFDAPTVATLADAIVAAELSTVEAELATPDQAS